jgi:hypothetical protein
MIVIENESSGKTRGRLVRREAFGPEQKEKCQVECQALISSVQLLTVTLVESVSKLMGAEQSESLVLSVERPQYRAHFDRTKSVLYCGVKLSLRLKPQDGKKDSVAFLCAAEYSLVYRVRDGISCSDECAMLFAERNAVFNAWPFFRELCFSQAGKSSFPHVMLPLFRLPMNNP